MKTKYTVLAFMLLFTATLTAQVDRTKVPIPGPAPKIEIGNYVKYELSNGLKIFVVEDHRLPQVAFSLSFIFDPEPEGAYAGTGNLMADLLGSGTKTRSKDQINESIDYMGATFTPSPLGIFASSLRKHSEKLIEIMSDVAQNSVFIAEELEKKRVLKISDLQASKDDPKIIAKNVFSSIIYGKSHPYGEFQTEESVKGITLEMCKSYYKKHFVPNIAYLTIVGDITPAEAKQLIEKYFLNWERGTLEKPSYAKPSHPAKVQVAIVDRPQSVQSVIRIGYATDLSIQSPDYIATRVTNTILGGVFCRLDENLREKHGFTYGARSLMNANPYVGSFEAYTSARNTVTDSAIDQMLYEMNRMVNEPVPAEELQQVKNFVSGNFALSLEEPQTIASFAVNIERFNLPKDFYSNYLKSIEAVTSADVQAVSKKYILPGNAVIFAVGKAAVIEEKMKRFSPEAKVDVYDITGNKLK